MVPIVPRGMHRLYFLKWIFDWSSTARLSNLCLRNVYPVFFLSHFACFHRLTIWMLSLIFFTFIQLVWKKWWTCPRPDCLAQICMPVISLCLSLGVFTTCSYCPVVCHRVFHIWFWCKLTFPVCCACVPLAQYDGLQVKYVFCRGTEKQCIGEFTEDR